SRQVALLAVDDLLQRHLLPDALPRARRHAASHTGLRAPVRGIQRDRLDRRVRIRPVAVVVPVDHPEGHGSGPRREGGRETVGGCRHARVDASPEPRALPQLPRAAGGEVSPERQQRNNLRTALVLGSIALAFFIGIMLKYLVLK